MVPRTLLALPRCCTARSKKVGCSLRLVCMATLILRRVSCSKYFCRDFDKNVPPGRDAVATRPQHGDINHESERTETTDGDGRAAGEGTAGGRSRDVAAVAAGGGPAHGASPQAGAPGMARAQAELRSDGATGRLAP